MKKLILIFIPLLLFTISCEEDEEEGQNCGNSSWISFDFQGTNLWDSDLGEYVSLDNIDIVVCDIDYQIGATCNNVFMDDVDINPDGTIDVSATIQYQCHPEAPGLQNGGFIAVNNFGFKNIASFTNSMNQALDVTIVDPGGAWYYADGPLFSLGEGCNYQTSSGTYTFTEINLNSNTFKGSFSLNLVPSNLVWDFCFPELENVSVSGSFEFINFD